jgi:uncharacterized membrane protein
MATRPAPRIIQNPSLTEGTSMKSDPFMLLGAIGTLSVASVARGDAQTLEFIGAMVMGSFIALCASLLKSRKRKDGPTERNLAAMIAVTGSLGLAFFFAPLIEGRIVAGVALSKPFAAFIITVAASPIIEWLLDGGPLRWVDEWRRKKGLAE